MSKDKKVTRREANERIIGLVALATGMSVFQVESALGQYKPRTLDSSKYKPRELKPQAQQPTVKPMEPGTNTARTLIVSQKTDDTALTRLKVALEDDMGVFESQYGRLTPIKQVRAEQIFAPDKVPGDLAGDMMGVCVTNFGSVAGNIGVVSLGSCDNINNCHGQGLDGPCDGANTCTGGQDCSDMTRCDENTCTGGQDCDNFQACQGTNSQTIVNTGMLDHAVNDLYVQLLMAEFNVKTTAALADAINTHFDNIAAGRDSFWPPN
jgi:hypothetical protein